MPISDVLSCLGAADCFRQRWHNAVSRRRVDWRRPGMNRTTRAVRHCLEARLLACLAVHRPGWHGNERSVARDAKTQGVQLCGGSINAMNVNNKHMRLSHQLSTAAFPQHQLQLLNFHGPSA